MDLNYELIDSEIIDLHNRVRADPQSFIPYLEEVLTFFKGDVMHKPGEVPIQTIEGKEGVEEAIQFLRNQRPIEGLISHDGLNKAARDHLNDIGPKGLVTHDGSDGSNVSDRIERYAEWEITCAENIDFGNRKALDFVLGLIIDDGVTSRGHRKNLFSEKAKYIGLASGPHKEYETCAVIDYVGGIRDKDKPYFDYKNFKYQYPDDLSKKPDKSKRPKNSYQLDDEDAPDDTVSIKVIKQAKLYNGRVHRVTKKIYTLSDGSTEIVEIEDA